MEFKQPQFESYRPKSCEIESKNATEDIPNELKEYSDAPLVIDRVSDNKVCPVKSPVVVEKKIIIPTIAKVEVVRPKQQEKSVRKTVGTKAVNTARPRPTVVNAVRANQNKALVVKPHNKTPYELFRGRTPALSFMRPFGCHVTILNSLDHLGKFNGKTDEGYFVGYSLNSKAFRVYIIRTRRVEENLHIEFLENKPIVAGARPEWLFDIDMLTKSMNYVPVIAGTNSNDFTGTKDSIGAGQSSMETGSSDKESGALNEINYAFENLNIKYPNDPKMPEAMQEKLLHFKLQKVWILVDLPKGKKAIGNKWVFRNKKDERGFVIKNKASIEEEVYVCQPIGFEDPDHPDKVYKVVKTLYGLHQAPRACQDKYVNKVLRKFNFLDVKSASTLVDIEKTLVNGADGDDVDVHLYRSMIGSLMYLTASRPDIIDSPFELVAYTDSDYAGASLDKKSTIGGCQFLGSGLISWQCKKKTVVATSTTKAEYVAAASCCGKVLWI
nr:retrovirus-related Pol polyprotein from transposon TNT 1-94 [Tanacetum cinerariifolium]